MTREAAEEILELPHRYTKEDVRRAYTDMARKYHPDAAESRHMDPGEAQRLMVEANKAHAVLKGLFKDDPNRVAHRLRGDAGGIAGGFSGVDWRSDFVGKHADPEDPWSFVDDWGVEPAPEKVPLSVRSVLLGPIVLRVLLIAAFAYLWWNTFPLLQHNLGRYVPPAGWSMKSVFFLVSGLIYPSYLFVYELLSGHISNFVREVLNGLVSWVTCNYVDLRPHSSSYGCALYKLLRDQVYALLMAPIVVWLASLCMDAATPIGKAIFGVAAILMCIDTLAACVHGGRINTWTTALAERVEARYLLLRAKLLRRCGKWGGTSE